MTHDMAKQFWNVYIGMASKNGANVDMFNPTDNFKASAHAGEFDALTDDQYYRKEADASVRTDYYTEEKAQECDEAAFNPDLDFSPEDGSENSGNFNTPRSIYEYLSQHIYGQEMAKRAASMLMWHHSRGNSRNIVMAGATGCGKTEIWRTLSKKFDCIRIVNGPQLTCDGWKGSYQIKDIFTGEAKGTAEHFIIVIDEADKLFELSVGSGGTDFGQKIQNELLKIMDGGILGFVDVKDRSKKIMVDCSGISIVLCGSFERMLQGKTESSENIDFGRQGRKESRIAECTEEDLIQYGNIRREIAGRISQIVTLETLDVDDFEKILESECYPYRRWKRRIMCCWLWIRIRGRNWLLTLPEAASAAGTYAPSYRVCLTSRCLMFQM